LKNRVHELVNLPNEDLLALYNRAEALIFPSLAEGAGWPPIEAQACGCPAIISDIPPLNEISIRSAAIFINPLNIPNAVIRIRAGLQNRDALRQAGFENAERYSERNMLTEYLDVYKRSINLFNMNVQSQK
jgi:glycosyltransferase involved in cell wall biosynthesis